MDDSRPTDPAPAAGVSGAEQGIDALAARYLDGVATPADVARLEAALAADPSARRAFLALCALDSALDERAAEWRESLAAAAGGRAAWTAAADGVAPADDATHATPADDITAITAADVTPADGGQAVATIAAARGRRRLLAVVTAAVAAAACLALPLVLRPRAEARGHYDDRPFPVATVATIRDAASPARSRPITPTTLRAAAATSLRSARGADVELLDAAIFGVSAGDEGALFGGGVLARLAGPRARFSVTTANLRVVDLGTSFRVERIDDRHVAVSVVEGAVEVQSRGGCRSASGHSTRSARAGATTSSTMRAARSRAAWAPPSAVCPASWVRAPCGSTTPAPRS